MRKALIVLALVSTMLVGTTAAFAAIATDLSVRYNATTERFHGKVGSSDSDCEAGRTVKVFKKTANGPVLQGKTMSTGTGAWRVTVMHASGHYFARTPQHQGMHGVCEAARSKTVDVM